VSVTVPIGAFKHKNGHVYLRSVQVSASQLTLSLGLAWLGFARRGLAWLGKPPFTPHYRRSTHQERDLELRHIKKEETTPDCPATIPRGPGTPPLSQACCQKHSSHSCTCHEPLQFTHDPPANLSRASKQYILARGRPDASSLYSSPALRHS